MARPVRASPRAGGPVGAYGGTHDDKRGTCDTEKGCETDHTVPPGKTPPPSTNVPPSTNIPPPNNPQPAPQSSGILARTGTTVLSAAALGTLLILGGLSLVVAFRRRQRHNS
ncbi:LPXTG cell wall anchor domain-containing protein [Streptomyces sp. NPDC057545]|uniref:LPXTG cell wall anchor domain-containing protein n=1 Tax=unclassified Streptomyces TaxID=2593676 RepID=UPI0036CD747A